MQKNVDEISIKLEDAIDLSEYVIDIAYSDGEHYTKNVEGEDIRFPVKAKNVDSAIVTFVDAEVAVVKVSYFKNGKVVGSSLVQNGSCELKLLKYKVELPRGAKVTLFDDETLEAQFLSWNVPYPDAFPNMTFLQVKAANGFEQQITPSAGSQTIELYQELGRRYAVFGEIWSYSFAQTLWFASLRIQLSNYEWQDVVPTAGEGGTIVTALPQ